MSNHWQQAEKKTYYWLLKPVKMGFKNCWNIKINNIPFFVSLFWSLHTPSAEHCASFDNVLQSHQLLLVCLWNEYVSSPIDFSPWYPGFCCPLLCSMEFNTDTKLKTMYCQNTKKKKKIESHTIDLNYLSFEIFQGFVFFWGILIRSSSAILSKIPFVYE